MGPMPDLEVLYCDNHVLAVVKPAGLPVVPDESGDRSLLELAKAWVKREYDKPGEVFLGVVHRLDRPVQGVVVFGRTSKGASRLSAAWRDGRVVKRYRAWSPSTAELPTREGTLALWQLKDPTRNFVTVLGVAPIDAGEDDRDHRAGGNGALREGGGAPSRPHPDAQRAVTRWKVTRQDARGTFLELEPVTGRKHQLRLACRHLGWPLAGDLKYGAQEPLPDKSIGLCATELEVPHPTRHERLRWRVAPPWKE